MSGGPSEIWNPADVPPGIIRIAIKGNCYLDFPVHGQFDLPMIYKALKADGALLNGTCCIPFENIAFICCRGQPTLQFSVAATAPGTDKPQ